MARNKGGRKAFHTLRLDGENHRPQRRFRTPSQDQRRYVAGREKAEFKIFLAGEPV